MKESGLRNFEIMAHATSFDDVPYFRNQFRGDLIITTGVLYYFPHTNVAAAKPEKKNRPTEHLDFLWHLFGLSGAIFLLVADSLFDISSFLWRALKATQNKPELRKLGLWRDGEFTPILQQRLDAYIAETRREVSPMVEYEYSLPKPMRFTRTEIRNLSLRRGSLRFETEFDSHEFRIGFRRQKSLRELLWESGFFQGGAMPNKSLDRSAGSVFRNLID